MKEDKIENTQETEEESLLEKYSHRLNIADREYFMLHQGKHLDDMQKVIIARCLDNTQKVMKEAYFASSQGLPNPGNQATTEFLMNTVSGALSNIISYDLAMTYPMYSMSGDFNCIRFRKEDGEETNHKMLCSIPVTAEAKKLCVLPQNIFSSLLEMQDEQTQDEQMFKSDIEAQREDKMVEQLIYEIDRDTTQCLIDHATIKDDLIWSKTPVNMYKPNIFKSFAQVIERGEEYISKNTNGEFKPTYILVSPSVIPVLSSLNEWKGVAPHSINGTYVCGLYKDMKVILTPNMPQGEFILGVNAPEEMYSAVAYFPYLPIIPSNSLKTTEDNTLNTGYITLSVLQFLDDNAIVAGKIVD